ncbi:MAG: hypothetical protein CMQ38_09490 [Gammaproteobacteria bacterium]|nr:hypothetical protein [Gammaproteobacteria bacterium]|tara:strand:+ start:232 stop:624 length:393 start_codon:yes stop_codon:yes gene_type:complete
MSLIFLAFLAGLGSFPILILQDIIKKNEDVANVLVLYLTGYSMILLVGAIGSIISGAIGWLRNGEWFDLDLNYAISHLDENSDIAEFLLAETTWVGVERLSVIYLDLNLAFSFVAAVIISFLVMMQVSKI